MIFRSKQPIGKIFKSSSKSIGASRYNRNKRRHVALNLLKKTLLAGSVLGIFGLISASIFVAYISKKLPDIESINTYIPAETTKIYAKDGTVLAELHQEENRILIPIEKISPNIVKTVIAMEDTDFYKHNGINIKGIMRAIYVDIKARSFVEGGSTLTQQLARNLFLYKQKKIVRKLAEMVLAIKIEKKFTKTEILEMYLNQVYWGHNAYGIESASRMYFGKPSAELNLSESAALVGMLSGPELYSPFRNFQRCKERQKIVLQRMRKLEIISLQEYRAALNETLVLAERKKHRYKAPYFTSYVVEKLVEMYGEESTYTSGMNVYTTLDYNLQQHAEKVVKEAIELGQQSYWIKGEKVENLNYNEAALLSIDPRNGHILVMQGGASYKDTQFNRTVQAFRQPGSAFKPFVYLAALEKGLSPGTFIEDKPITFNTIEGTYEPLNYTLKHLGNIPMTKALERSVNVVAVKLNDLVGPQNVVNVARKSGIVSPLKPILSLPLGANEVTMMELTTAYMTFANNGIKVNPVAILKIEDRDGIPLYKHVKREKRVLDANHVAALVEMMQGVVNYGTGRGAKLPRPIAGKTGTTSDYKDAWFMGFVPQMVTAAWVGNDDNDPMKNVTGGWIPAYMWKEFMKEALRNVKAQSFPRPRGMVVRKVNWDTGLLASEFTPEDAKVTDLKYWRGSEPVESDSQSSISKVKKAKQQEQKEENELLDFFDIN